MIKNYFKIAWRNLIWNKAFSTINILGLASGMACSLLIMLWVQDERNVDAFHANGKQLFQVYERNFFDGKIEADYPTQALLAEELKRVIPEIKNASSLEWNTTNTFEAGEKIDKMEGSFAGEDFFTMFSYPLIQGSAQTALNTLNGIAISRNMAEHFFGSAEKAIGKTIRYENYDNLQVTAVFENLPSNSSQQFDFLRSWLAFKKENSDWIDNWGNTDAPTFIQLQENANPQIVESKIKDFVYRYKEKSKGFRIELALQPYTEKYLHSTFKNGKVDGGRIEYVRLFTMVAIFILLIACINFMNLATARSAKRAKEVGIRKVVGAARFTLMGQFIGEAMLLTFLSFIIAIALTIAFLPAFNSLTGKQLSLPTGETIFWIRLIGLLASVGFVAGSYPALFLSSLKPIKVLKGSLKFNWAATFFRKGLVVFQFALSITMIIGMIVIYRQLHYVQTKNIGYDRESLLYIPLEGELGAKYSIFKEEAGKLPGIKEISKIRQSPTRIGNHTGDIKWVGKDPNLVASFVNTIVGYDFVKTMNLQLAEGRDFSKDYGTDSAGFILNETAIKKIGYKNPIGKQIWWGNREGRIVGVLKDFHFASMHEAIEPLIIRLDENRQWATILVRTEKGKTKEALTGLEKTYKTLNPKFPFTYQFSDLEFAKLYKSEQLVSRLSDYFAFLAIFISCLGLFGLATFATGQRTKEIGVRKVLGASVPNILALLSGNFLKPVAIAILIAFPVAWYVMNNWLEDFAYKIIIEWWVFAIAGLITVGMALLTVSYQAIKAAIANPVKSLRTE
jgi:ABC-type antimicrobial peptide transport system permease subunit